VKFFLLFLIPSFFSLELRADIINIASDPWFPYTGKNSDESGYVIELVTEIFKEAGHTVKYSALPWSRAIDLTRRGKLNAIACCYKEEARDFIFPKEEVGDSINRFYSLRPFKYSGVSSLKGLRIGVVKDYFYGEVVDKFLENNKLKIEQAKLEPVKANFKMLNRSRLDLVIANEYVAKSVIKRLNLNNIYASKKSLESSKKLWLCFSPNSPDSNKYSKIYSKGIEKFRSNGKLKRILMKYGLQDWKSSFKNEM
jgi:polar amino acid transport system substrate-binding protein